MKKRTWNQIVEETIVTHSERIAKDLGVEIPTIKVTREGFENQNIAACTNETGVYISVDHLNKLIKQQPKNIKYECAEAELIFTLAHEIKHYEQYTMRPKFLNEHILTYKQTYFMINGYGMHPLELEANTYAVDYMNRHTNTKLNVIIAERAKLRQEVAHMIARPVDKTDRIVELEKKMLVIEAKRAVKKIAKVAVVGAAVGLGILAAKKNNKSKGGK